MKSRFHLLRFARIFRLHFQIATFIKQYIILITHASHHLKFSPVPNIHTHQFRIHTFPHIHTFYQPPQMLTPFKKNVEITLDAFIIYTLYWRRRRISEFRLGMWNYLTYICKPFECNFTYFSLSLYIFIYVLLVQLLLECYLKFAIRS